MVTRELTRIVVQQKIVFSQFLNRAVLVDFYIPYEASESALHLLFINDGQDLVKMKFADMLNYMADSGQIQPLLCIGIHAGENRRVEYGTANTLDYGGRGAKAAAYNQFVLKELLPLIKEDHFIQPFISTNIAGFSLGGLTAIDMLWHYPELFSVVGVFSGSLWWRSKDITQGYIEDQHRIMHQQIRNGQYHAGLRFYFTTGSLDERADRNNNGVIDSIDDTLALIQELKKKGYSDADIAYVNFNDGRHDVETWGRAMPEFLRWGWGKNKVSLIPPESC